MIATRPFDRSLVVLQLQDVSDNESPSCSSQSSISVDEENIPINVIMPYQFEPEFSSSENGEEEDDRQHEDENSRTRNLNW